MSQKKTKRFHFVIFWVNLDKNVLFIDFKIYVIIHQMSFYQSKESIFKKTYYRNFLWVLWLWVQIIITQTLRPGRILIII